eukprot:gb/GECH01005568.1/.p1 GENE.gb/GECH01005568.1/~~gb/GECH01005568.1/.p1  ORF type:complete len:285 (+),score=44.88 gb/GECH01005568.1/:1-855(+)
MHVLKGHEKGVQTIVFTEQRIYTGSLDASIRAWDAAALTELLVFRGHTKTVASIKEVDDTLYSSSFDGHIRQWDTQTAACLHDLHAHNDTITAIRIIDKQFIFSSSSDGTVKKWDINTFECLQTFNTSNENDWVLDFALSTKHIYVATSSGNIYKFNTKTGKHVLSFEGHSGAVPHILIVKNYLVSASWDGTMCAFDRRSGRLKKVFDVHLKAIRCMISFPHHGHQYIITGSDDLSALVWDVKTGSCLYRLPHGAEVTELCPGEGNVLFTSAKDSQIRKFELPL